MSTLLKLTARQKRFADEYCKDLNGRASAIRAGYSKKTAGEMAYENLNKPHIRNYINKRLANLAIGPEEATKLIGDIARSNLNDYFTKKQVEFTPRISKPLADIIEECKQEVQFEEEFSHVAKYKGKALTAFNDAQKERKFKIMRYEFELKKNPKAYRIVDGPTVFVDELVLDLDKIVADKEKGRIKSFKYGKNGRPEVELYSADAALRDVGKIHGIFEKDNEQQKPTVKQYMLLNGKEIEF